MLAWAEMKEDVQTMRIRFDMIGIFAEDIERMVSFYRDTLGLPTEWKKGEPYAEFRHDGIRFSMYKRSELPNLLGTSPTYPAGMNGTFELAIDYPGPEDVDNEYRRLLGCGAKGVYAPREEPWGMYSSMVTDPEGNLIEIGSWRKGKPSAFRLGVVTLPVRDLAKSLAFYTHTLGFTQAAQYEPTHWVSFHCSGNAMLAIQQTDIPGGQSSHAEYDLYVEELDVFWERIHRQVEVVSAPEHTPWGSYKFVIRDPDGNRLGFVGQR